MDNPGLAGAVVIAAIVLVALVISSIVAASVSRRTQKSAAIAMMNKQLLKVNALAVECPYLKDDDFCNGWKRELTSVDDRYRRYHNYCSMVFNLIENLWDYYAGKEKKIEHCLDVKELVLRHKRWWVSEVQNKEGYRKEFRAFVNGYLS